ncbi:MAG: LLM class F420-dependent oxidoreductase [Actinobacteria bacterium]|nr:LLM class F420-dependent oxidoreductase [Actinomycetota bacterium]
MGQLRDRLGRFGIWRGGYQLRPAIAAEVEAAGFGALWVGGSPDGDLALVEGLLGVTRTLIVGTSIVNIWKDGAHEVARSFARVQQREPGRLVLGIGAGHREATQQYARPYEALAGYVDTLRDDGVPQEALVLAALGPRMLRLAGERAAGAIPYLVPPGHTRQAREILGPEPLLAPEHKVVLDADAGRARALGRARVQKPYLGLVNYTSNLRRLGWTGDDLRGGGSDELIDALVAHGGPGQVAAQLSRHLEAGADHVVIQLLTEPDADPVPGYRALAQALVP